MKIYFDIHHIAWPSMFMFTSLHLEFLWDECPKWMMVQIRDHINKALLSIGLERGMSQVMLALLSSRYAEHQLKVII